MAYLFHQPNSNLISTELAPENSLLYQHSHTILNLFSTNYSNILKLRLNWRFPKLKTDDSENLVSSVVTLIPKPYIDALLAFNKMVEDRNVSWAVGGDMGEILRTVNVEPDCIEILTSEEGATQIWQSVQEYKPTEATLQTQLLQRPFKIEEKEFPVYVRSHYFEFNLNGIKIKIHGNLQYRIDRWDWGDPVEFKPDEIYVLNKKINVVPLPIKYEIYVYLRWTDRAEKISRVLLRGRRKHR